MDTRILIPVRYAAWLSGDLGRDLETSINHGLPEARIQRLPRGFLVEADEDAGPFVELVAGVARDLESAVQERYPVFHREMGPVWTGTLQVVFQ